MLLCGVLCLQRASTLVGEGPPSHSQRSSKRHRDQAAHCLQRQPPPVSHASEPSARPTSPLTPCLLFLCCISCLQRASTLVGDSPASQTQQTGARPWDQAIDCTCKDYPKFLRERHWPSTIVACLESGLRRLHAGLAELNVTSEHTSAAPAATAGVGASNAIREDLPALPATAGAGSQQRLGNSVQKTAGGGGPQQRRLHLIVANMADVANTPASNILPRPLRCAAVAMIQEHNCLLVAAARRLADVWGKPLDLPMLATQAAGNHTSNSSSYTLLKPRDIEHCTARSGAAPDCGKGPGLAGGDGGSRADIRNTVTRMT